jgi:hypothetical protein
MVMLLGIPPICPSQGFLADIGENNRIVVICKRRNLPSTNMFLTWLINRDNNSGPKCDPCGTAVDVLM